MKKPYVEWPHQKADSKKTAGAVDKTMQDHINNIAIHLSDKDISNLTKAAALAGKNFDELYAAKTHTHKGLFVAPKFRFDSATGSLIMIEEEVNSSVLFKVNDGFLIVTT